MLGGLCLGGSLVARQQRSGIQGEGSSAASVRPSVGMLQHLYLSLRSPVALRFSPAGWCGCSQAR